ncbi:cytochrome P450 [Plantactinospora sp. CA-294935]|uniref:cytochrome P450 n=1 Tax=Plantactinospora sp. CA-294935 TaxID=3240012 RepID=UPI003D941D32
MSLADLVGLAPDALRDPGSVYDELRAKGVHFAPEVNAYVVAGHDDVSRVLRDAKRFSSTITVGNPPPSPTDDPNRLRPLLLLSDDPVHATRRSIVNRAFTPSQVRSWEPVVRRIAEQHVDALRDADTVDLVERIAAPLPVRVISALLGVPADDVDKFRAWSEEITGSLGGHAADPEKRDRVQREFTGYMDELMNRHDGRAGDDVLSTIVAADRAGELTRREAVSFTIELLIAGNITTTHHLASSMKLLAEIDGLADRLRAEPALIPRFVEESLRLESPIQGFYRLALQDSVVGGTEIPAGSRLLVLYQAANRDPAAWEQCPHLKLDRPNASAHLAFGKGPHACIGSSLARLEGVVVVETLLDRVAGITLLTPRDEVPYLASFINHGPTSLPARLVFRPTGEPS